MSSRAQGAAPPLKKKETPSHIIFNVVYFTLLCLWWTVMLLANTHFTKPDEVADSPLPSGPFLLLYLALLVGSVFSVRTTRKGRKEMILLKQVTQYASMITGFVATLLTLYHGQDARKTVLMFHTTVLTPNTCAVVSLLGWVAIFYLTGLKIIRRRVNLANRGYWETYVALHISCTIHAIVLVTCVCQSVVREGAPFMLAVSLLLWAMVNAWVTTLRLERIIVFANMAVDVLVVALCLLSPDMMDLFQVPLIPGLAIIPWTLFFIVWGSIVRNTSEFTKGSSADKKKR